MQTTILNILFCCIFILICPVLLTAQEIETQEGIEIEADRDTLVSVGDSLPLAQTIKIQDSILSDTLKPKENQLLTDVVTYTATDYMRLSQKENRMYLYNEAQVVYGDMTMNAGLIVIDNNKNEVYAYGIPDSTGAYSQKPVFTQADQTIEPDSLRFNIDTERALVYNSRTQQASFNVLGEVTKRENDSVYFMQNVRFTTSENVENPDYYFYARRIKFVPDKKIVSGLVNMYIADVPTPLGLPFGYFPMTDEETSGFIMPSFGDSRQGYFLQNGGYYFAISDYADLMVLGDYYTNGSYGLRTETNYAKRYRFRGNVRLRYENQIQSERGFPDYSEGSIYSIQWSHNQDAKANPNSRFSASVNIASSEYYQQSVNQSNTGNFLNNTLSSSVSYSKTFEGEPQINLSLAARHTQNLNTETINMSLPTAQVSMSRIYPFAPKSGSKKGAIENINFNYNFRGENQITTTDSLFFKPEMFQDANIGAQHTIPVSTNFKLFKYFSASVNANYNESWVFKTFERSWDQVENREVIDTINKFDSYRTYNFSSSIGTTVYGLKNFGKGKKIEAIRHVMRPSISYNINPGFDQYYDSYERINESADPMETNMVDYSRFQGSLFGAPGRNFSSSIGMSISNTLEAKVRSKDSTATEPEKITLLNNFSLSTAYNLAGDSLKLSPIAIRGSIPIIRNKLDINVAGNMDIYALDNNNRRIDRLNIENGGSLFRFTNANVSFGYSFSNKDFEDDVEDDDEIDNETYRNGGRRDDLFGKGTDLDGRFYDEEEDDFADEDRDERDDKWYNYKIPWDLRLSYTMTYNNNQRQNEITSHSIMFSGDVEVSPKWIVGGSSGFDLKEQGFTYTQLRFQRDLDSWRMSFNWVPFDVRASWYFFIGIKSSILSDIKYDKRREPDRQL